MYAYNSRFWMESVNGGAFAIDPSFGPGLGQGNPFVVGDDGTIVPKCIDSAIGELKLDKDGFPVGMNFWAGMDGQVYVRGNIYATDGVFNGIVKATDFQLPSGDSMVSILNNDGKIKGDWLELMGINIKNDAGQTVMTIDQSGVKFGSTFSPIKTRYSTNKEATIPSGWSDTWNSSWNGTSTEVWAIYSYDSGVSWTSPMLAQGKTGEKGSDANVPAWVKSITATYIDSQWVIAPNIAGGTITALDRMEATCDFYVGDNIYLGDLMSSGKAIILGQRVSISNPFETDSLELNALGNIRLITSNKLDLSGVGDIIWGKNAPRAVFS